MVSHDYGDRMDIKLSAGPIIQINLYHDNTGEQLGDVLTQSTPIPNKHEVISITDVQITGPTEADATHDIEQGTEYRVVDRAVHYNRIASDIDGNEPEEFVTVDVNLDVLPLDEYSESDYTEN